MFSQGVSCGWNLDSRGGGLGVEQKKFSRLVIARHDPHCNTPLIFTLFVTTMKLLHALQIYSSLCEEVYAIALFKVVHQQTIGKVGNSIICL